MRPPGDGACRTLVSLVSELQLPVCLMRTFSKIYGMAGQRIGYGVLPPVMAAHMAKFVPWSGGVLNRIGTVGAIASLQVQAARTAVLPHSRRCIDGAGAGAGAVLAAALL